MALVKAEEKILEKIKKIDEELTTVFNEFGQIAEDLKFNSVCKLSEEETIKNQKYPGIYLIEIKVEGNYQDFKSWVTDFKEKWEHEDFKKKFTPNTKKKRIEKHLCKTLGEWVPIYIGKSRNVGNRVMEHLYLDLNQPTTSLKIKARKNLNSQVFQLSSIKVEVINYDLIMPLLEKALRNKYNPILGRQ